MNKFILAFLPFAIAITFITGVVYVVLQQEIRNSANNPQIEVAEDAINLINSGASPMGLFLTKQIDIETRLKTFQIIYDDEGKVIGSNALLDKEAPIPPKGVFDYVRKNGESRITWEPKKGVRIAAVTKRFGGDNATTSGFVLVGRSLREVEKREKNLGIEILFGWLATMIATGISLVINKKIEERTTIN